MSKKLILFFILLCSFLFCNRKSSYKKVKVFPGTTLNEILDSFTPSNQNQNRVITYSHYKISFSEKHRQAHWSFYMLTSNMLEKNSNRSNDFRVDPNVISCATLEDYKNSGYDRGHLVPAADMAFNDNAMSETFFMTNMSPQNPSFNRGKWVSLENKFREWAVKYDTIFVITAGILNEEITEFIGTNNVSVPKYFYKIALVYKQNEKKAIAFKMENTKLERDLDFYSTNIREIEKLTGIDFFYLMDKKEQDLLENQNNYINW